MRYALISLICVIGVLQAALTANASEHSAKTLRYIKPVLSKAQCVQQILAYRSAISFLEGQLEKSPQAVIYKSPTGKTLKVENRFRKQVQYNQGVLRAGLSSKMSHCRSALS